MESKTCIHCEREKLLSEFYRQSRNKDGHRSECMTCTKLQAKGYAPKRTMTSVKHPFGTYMP